MAEFKTTFVLVILLQFSSTFLIGCAQQLENDSGPEAHLSNWQSSRTGRFRTGVGGPSRFEVKNSSPEVATSHRQRGRLRFDSSLNAQTESSQYRQPEGDPLQRTAETPFPSRQRLEKVPRQRVAGTGFRLRQQPEAPQQAAVESTDRSSELRQQPEVPVQTVTGRQFRPRQRSEAAQRVLQNTETSNRSVNDISLQRVGGTQFRSRQRPEVPQQIPTINAEAQPQPEQQLNQDPLQRVGGTQFRPRQRPEVPQQIPTINAEAQPQPEQQLDQDPLQRIGGTQFRPRQRPEVPQQVPIVNAEAQPYPEQQPNNVPLQRVGGLPVHSTLRQGTHQQDAAGNAGESVQPRQQSEVSFQRIVDSSFNSGQKLEESHHQGAAENAETPFHSREQPEIALQKVAGIPLRPRQQPEETQQQKPVENVEQSQQQITGPSFRPRQRVQQGQLQQQKPVIERRMEDATQTEQTLQNAGRPSFRNRGLGQRRKPNQFQNGGKTDSEQSPAPTEAPSSPTRFKVPLAENSVRKLPASSGSFRDSMFAPRQKQQEQNIPAVADVTTVTSPKPFRGRTRARITDIPRKSGKLDEISESDNYPAEFIEKLKNTEHTTGRSRLRQREAKPYPEIGRNRNHFRQRSNRLQSTTEETKPTEKSRRNSYEARQRSRSRFTTEKPTTAEADKPTTFHGARFSSTTETQETAAPTPLRIPRKRIVQRLRKVQPTVADVPEPVGEEEGRKPEALESAEYSYYVHPENTNIVKNLKHLDLDLDLHKEASNEDSEVYTEKTLKPREIGNEVATTNYATATIASVTTTEAPVTSPSTRASVTPTTSTEATTESNPSTRHRFSSKFNRSNNTAKVTATPTPVKDAIQFLSTTATETKLSTNTVKLNTDSPSLEANRAAVKRKAQNKKSKKSLRTTTTASPFGFLNNRPILRNIASLLINNVDTTTKRSATGRKRDSKPKSSTTTSTTTTTTTAAPTTTSTLPTTMDVPTTTSTTPTTTAEPTTTPAEVIITITPQVIAKSITKAPKKTKPTNTVSKKTTRLTTTSTTTTSTPSAREESEIKNFISETVGVVQNRSGFPANIRVAPRVALSAITPEISPREETITEPVVSTTERKETTRNVTSQYIYFDYNSTTPIPRQFERMMERGRYEARLPSTSTADYFVYGVYPNNTVVRKRAWKTFDYEKYRSPYLIFGIYPNNTLVKKFPNGTIIKDEYMDSDNEIRDVDSFRRPSYSVTLTSTSTTTSERPITTTVKGEESFSTEANEDEYENEIQREEKKDEESGQATTEGPSPATEEHFLLEPSSATEEEDSSPITEGQLSTTEKPSFAADDSLLPSNNNEESLTTTGQSPTTKKPFFPGEESLIGVSKNEESSPATEHPPTTEETFPLAEDPSSATEDNEEPLVATGQLSTTEEPFLAENGPSYRTEESSPATERPSTTEESLVLVDDFSIDEDDKFSSRSEESFPSTEGFSAISEENGLVLKTEDTSAATEGSSTTENLFSLAREQSPDTGEYLPTTERSFSTTEKDSNNFLQNEEFFPSTPGSVSVTEENGLSFRIEESSPVTEEPSKIEKLFPSTEEPSPTTEEQTPSTEKPFFQEEESSSVTEGSPFENDVRSRFGFFDVIDGPTTELNSGTTKGLFRIVVGDLPKAFLASFSSNRQGKSLLFNDISTEKIPTTTQSASDRDLFFRILEMLDAEAVTATDKSNSTTDRSSISDFDLQQIFASTRSPSFGSTTDSPVTDITTRNGFLDGILFPSTTTDRNNLGVTTTITNDVLPLSIDYARARGSGNTSSSTEQDENYGVVNLAFRTLGSSNDMTTPETTQAPKFITVTKKSTKSSVKKVRMKMRRTTMTTPVPRTTDVFIVTPSLTFLSTSSDNSRATTKAAMTAITTDSPDGLTLSSTHVQKVTKAPVKIPKNLLKSVVEDIEQKSIPEILKNVEKELQGNGLSVSLARRIVEMAIERAMTTQVPDPTTPTPATTTAAATTATTPIPTTRVVLITSRLRTNPTQSTTPKMTTSKPTTTPFFTTRVPTTLKPDPNTEIVTVFGESFNSISVNPLNANFRDFADITTSNRVKLEDTTGRPSAVTTTTAPVASGKNKSSRNLPTKSELMNTLSKSDKQLLEAILSQQNSDLSVQKLEEIIGNQIRLAEQVRKASKSVKKRPRTTTTTTTTTPKTPPLFGFLLGLLSGTSSSGNDPVVKSLVTQTKSNPKFVGGSSNTSGTTGSTHPDPLREPADGQTGERATRGDLVTAAIDVTKAISKFMGTVISSAAQSFHSFFSGLGRTR